MIVQGVTVPCKQSRH